MRCVVCGVVCGVSCGFVRVCVCVLCCGLCLASLAQLFVLWFLVFWPTSCLCVSAWVYSRHSCFEHELDLLSMCFGYANWDVCSSCFCVLRRGSTGGCPLLLQRFLCLTAIFSGPSRRIKCARSAHEDSSIYIYMLVLHYFYDLGPLIK